MIRYQVRSRQLVDVMNDVRSQKLTLSPYFQRKLVWRMAHRVDFIKTILLGFPFPEIFLARGEIDVESMVSTSAVVDGQQRLTSIKQFIDGGIEVDAQRYQDLSVSQKEQFLKYEIAVIELDLAQNDPKIIDMFKRLNRTFYGLSNIEKQSTEFASSEFMLIAKMLCGDLRSEDEKLTDNVDKARHTMDPNVSQAFTEWGNSKSIASFLKFFLGSGIFTAQEIARQVPLAYALNFLSTLAKGEYYGRNEAVAECLEEYTEGLPNRDSIVDALEKAAAFVLRLNLKNRKFWLSKSNSFSLLLVAVELLAAGFRAGTKDLRAALDAFAESHPADYALAAKEAVNNKRERTLRAKYIREVFASVVAEGLK